jgi:hypothetical protein
MPIHDWTRVSAGGFHTFHQDWTVELYRTLNRGLLPPGYAAYTDLRVSGREPDVITIQSGGPAASGATAVADAPPRSRQVARVESEAAAYARKANRISIRHEFGTIVAIIEVLSPGNKDSKHSLGSFVSKAVEFLRSGIHLLMIDLFPPTPRDPAGIHQAVWECLTDEPFAPRPAEKPLTVASYDAGDGVTAYVDPLAVGDVLPDAPLFLAPGRYVAVPLERTYMTCWEATPRPIRDLVAPPDPAPARP